MGYKYYQPNDKDLKDMIGDCAIRAITKATDKTWLETFDNLYKYAREAQCLPNQKPAYTPYLESLGFSYHSAPKKTTVKLLAKHREDTVVAYIRTGYQTHLVCIQDHNWHDTWDCGDKYVFGWWEKEV